MLRNRMMGGSSWLALRAADDEGAGGGGDGDAGGDNGGSNEDAGAGAGAGGGEGAEGDPAKPGAKNDGAAAERQDGGTDGGAGAGAGEDAGKDGAAAAGAGAEDWRDKDRERLRRRVREEAEAKAAIEAENKRLTAVLERMAAGGDGGAGDGGAGAGDGGPRTYTMEEVRREAARLAAETVNEERGRQAKAAFDNSCNTAVTAGRADYGAEKFDASLTRLTSLGFYGDDPRNPDLQNLTMVLETDDPHGVMHELGQNPAEYQRIVDLPPLRRHGEFVKLAIKAQASRVAAGGSQKRPSAAPPPIEPIGGSGGETDNRYADNAPSADWHAAEEKRERAYWEKKNAQFRAG